MKELELLKGDWERIRDATRDIIREQTINLKINQMAFEFAEAQIKEFE